MVRSGVPYGSGGVGRHRKMMSADPIASASVVKERLPFACASVIGVSRPGFIYRDLTVVKRGDLVGIDVVAGNVCPSFPKHPARVRPT